MESGSSSDSEGSQELAARPERTESACVQFGEVCAQTMRASSRGNRVAPRREVAASGVEPRAESLPAERPLLPLAGPASSGPADSVQIAVAALANCAWVASSYRAEFRVHVCDAGSSVPLCKQKRGGEARGVRRAAAQGEDWEALTQLPAPYAFCDACSQKLGVTAALARAAVDEIVESTFR